MVQRKMPINPEPRLTIGVVARVAGVHPETVRYYERIGLLPRPARTPGSVRRYPAAALQRVRFIKRAQWLGFSLDEVAVLLALAQGRVCCETRALGEVKLTLVREKLEQLSAVCSALEALLVQCAAAQGPGCPLLDALLSDGDSPLHGNGKSLNPRRKAPLVGQTATGTAIISDTPT